MINHVVTALGSGVGDPYIVATEPAQRDRLVRLALRDPGRTGTEARDHGSASFHLADRPLIDNDPPGPHQFLQVGFFAGFGGALFYEDPRVPGDNSPTDKDWAWIAILPKPVHDPPVVYFDQPSQTQFPLPSVMPIDELRDLVLEYLNTGRRPTSVEWLTVNDLRWTLDRR